MQFGNGSMVLTPKGGGSAAAVSGLSLSTGLGGVPSGDLQLGQTLGDPANPAALLDIAEIPLNGQQLRLTEPLSNIIFTNGNVNVSSAVVDTSVDLFSSGTLRLTNNSGAGTPPLIQFIKGIIAADNLIMQLPVAAGAPLQFAWNAVTKTSFDNQGNIITEGSIKTADPSTGRGLWKLGQSKAGAGLTLKATEYLEINVDGVVKKVAVVN